MNRRVDALYSAFSVTLHPTARDELHERQAIADEVGEAELRIGGFAFQMKRSRTRDIIPFRNADVRGAVVERERPEPRISSNDGTLAKSLQTVELEFFATYLATHTLEVVIAMACSIAAEFGIVEEALLRRVDLCADFVGYPLAHDDLSGYLTQRARKSSFLTTDPKDEGDPYGEAYSVAAREHRKCTNQVTGFSFAPGNALSARVYDKSEELSLPAREIKREIEHNVWRNNGWDGNAKVTRVEFQLRSSVLRELNLRNPLDLQGALDELWQYGSSKWLRLSVPGSATRVTNWDLDQRWVAVQAVTFAHDAQPRKRTRVSGGATVEHVIGALRSQVASEGNLKRVELATSDGEVLRNERELVDSMSEAQQENFVRREFRSLTTKFLLNAPDEYLRKRGTRDAAYRLLTGHNATAARFASLDERTPKTTRAKARERTENETP